MTKSGNFISKNLSVRMREFAISNSIYWLRNFSSHTRLFATILIFESMTPTPSSRATFADYCDCLSMRKQVAEYYTNGLEPGQLWCHVQARHASYFHSHDVMPAIERIALFVYPEYRPTRIIR
jgi:hypothetical protein